MTALETVLADAAEADSRSLSRKKCACGRRSLPGLHGALCQYHYNRQVFGEEWANYCAGTAAARLARPRFDR